MPVDVDMQGAMPPQSVVVLHVKSLQPPPEEPDEPDEPDEPEDPLEPLEPLDDDALADLPSHVVVLLVHAEGSGFVRLEHLWSDA